MIIVKSYHWRTSALAALSVCLIAAVAGAANAAEPVRSLNVPYDDLNLGSEQGNNALYNRIVAAAREVCRAGHVDIRELRVFADERACETHAIAHAVQQVPSAKLGRSLNSARSSYRVGHAPARWDGDQHPMFVRASAGGMP